MNVKQEFKIKCNYRLLMSCNEIVEGLDGQKMHKVKLLAFYCFLKSRFKSSHIHNISTIPKHFTDLKGLCSNSTFNKYCRLLLKHGMAVPHKEKGIVLCNIQHLTNVLANTKAKCNKEKWFVIRRPKGGFKLTMLQKEFENELFLNRFQQIYWTVENRQVKQKGEERLMFKKSLRNYLTTPFKISNKTIGTLFKRSRGFAKKVKAIIEHNTNMRFETHIVNSNHLPFIQNNTNFYCDDVITFKGNQFMQFKNLGQRIVIL